jgi:hypothetical protein
MGAGKYVHTFTPMQHTTIGHLSVPDAKAKVRVFGILPGVATIRYAEVGTTPGFYYPGDLIGLAPTFSLKVPSITVFGVPVLQSGTCAGSSTVKVNLNPPNGTANLTQGEYAIPAFTGCGPATSALTSQLSGPGNTLVLKRIP